MDDGINNTSRYPRELVHFLETFSLPKGKTVAAFLSLFDDLMNATSKPIPVPEVFVLNEVNGWQVRVAVWKNDSAKSQPVILHIHGGAWVSGNHLSHRGFAAEMVAAGFIVVTLDYRRAPKHPFPAALEDCAETLSWCRHNIHRHGGDGDRISIVGDSAGANLAASMVASTRIRVRALALLYGIFDYHAALGALTPLFGEPIRERQPYLPHGAFEALRGDSRVSPLYAPVAWPAMYLGVGDHDPLLAESQRLHEELVRRDVRHEFDVFPDLPHSYIQLPGSPAYPRALERLIGFLLGESGDR